MTLGQEDFDKIERYTRIKVSDIEKAYVESLFTDGENNLLLRQGLEKDWNSTSSDNAKSETDLTYLLERIHRSIRKNEYEKMQKPVRKFIRGYSKIAASLLLPIIIAGLAVIGYMNRRYAKIVNNEISTTIFAPRGSRVTFNLPDGTKGVLNSGSKLSYTLPFIEKRNLRLDGEAWFEVKHNSEHPFSISAGKSTVKVLGTSFNLSTYPDENYIEVVLKEGLVKFLPENIDNGVAMIASERLVFCKGRILKTHVDPEKYKAWTDGKLVFRSDPMAEVARRIERWYNVNIIINDRDLEKYTFRATFQDDKLEDVIKFLAMTSPISYKITPRKILPDGTVQKEVIRIYKNNR